MFFGKKDKEAEKYEDPATSNSRSIRREKGRDQVNRSKRTIFEKIFGMGHDSDFVYYDN